MNKRILAIALALMMCLTLLPLTAAGANYTSTKLNIPADLVVNCNGYAMTGAEGENEWGTWIEWDEGLISSTGEKITRPGLPTEDGYYYGNSKLFDSNFNKTMEFDPHEKVYGEPSPGGGMGSSWDIVANGGLIAIINEPLVILDYSGKVTGNYTPDAPLSIDPYGAGTGVNIGLDGLITLWQGQASWDGDEYKYVILDKTGKVLADLGMKYSNVGTVNEGLAWAFERVGEDEYIAYYIDSSGKQQITLDAESLYNFVDGYASVGVRVYSNIRYGIIDKTGAWVIEPQYENIFGKNGIFAARKDGKYGYVDTKNSILVPFEYDDISNYVNNVGYGIKDGELYLIKFSSEPSVETPSSWAVEQVNAAIEANLVPENLQSKYTQATTRAEFASLAVTLYETVTGNVIEIGDNPFTDTNDINAIKAAAIKVTTGTTATTFSPQANLTREQAATMLSRLANAM
ncbi:MAG: WG repeat-containing protein, partial [Oscillospiraceae bacterium]|nr:WG repeat-containing protein [Oscillospiraceae bacterium]